MNDNTEHRVSFEGVSVFVAMPAHRPLPVPTVLSLLATVMACIAKRIRINVAIPHNASVVTSARNHAAHLFLRSDYKFIFWIDSDMEWTPEAFFKVLAMAIVRDIARAGYPAKQEPLIFDFDGLGFCCVSRRVMEAMAGKVPTVFYGDHAPCKEIFIEAKRKSERATEAGADYEFLAEDTHFFMLARSLGFETWIDPEITLGHVGEKVYRGSVKKDAIIDGTRDGVEVKETEGA